MTAHHHKAVRFHVLTLKSFLSFGTVFCMSLGIAFGVLALGIALLDGDVSVNDQMVEGYLNKVVVGFVMFFLWPLFAGVLGFLLSLVAYTPYKYILMKVWKRGLHLSGHASE